MRAASGARVVCRSSGRFAATAAYRKGANALRTSGPPSGKGAGPVGASLLAQVDPVAVCPNLLPQGLADLEALAARRGSSGGRDADRPRGRAARHRRCDLRVGVHREGGGGAIERHSGRTGEVRTADRDARPNRAAGRAERADRRRQCPDPERLPGVVEPGTRDVARTPEVLAERITCTDPRTGWNHAYDRARHVNREPVADS